MEFVKGVPFLNAEDIMYLINGNVSAYLPGKFSGRYMDGYLANPSFMRSAMPYWSVGEVIGAYNRKFGDGKLALDILSRARDLYAAAFQKAISQEEAASYAAMFKQIALTINVQVPIWLEAILQDAVSFYREHGHARIVHEETIFNSSLGQDIKITTSMMISPHNFDADQ